MRIKSCQRERSHPGVEGLVILAGALLAALVFGVGQTAAAGIPFQTGDVLAGVGNGKVKHFHPDGTLVQTLDTTSNSGEDLGMCFDSAGNLYTTNSFGGGNSMSKFDNMGNLLVASWGGPFNQDPESCSVSTAQQVYVGQPDGSRDVLKFDTAGTLLDNYDVATQSRGSDWVDLAADQCTLFYTSEGSSIKRYDVCTKTQLADFATGLTGGACYALRIRTNGEVMVACTSEIHRLDSSGTVMQSYPTSGFTPSETFVFAANLDPDGTSFWTGGYSSGEIYRIDIASGNQLSHFNAGILNYAMSGLAVVGEITVAQPTPTPGPTQPAATPTPTTPASPIPLISGSGLAVFIGILALAGALLLWRRAH